ncbi:hypothetical protein [Vibrio harveyi]|uniref:hypothetical protein n=1 Tax=Vibrio harveyi TaxID=669 RepID=UPI003CF82185
MSRPTMFNGAGSEMPLSWFHVPYAYTKKHFGQSQLVIIEISKFRLAYALRSQVTNRVGMIRRTGVYKDKKRGYYFLYKGNKIFLNDIAVVL